MNTALMNHFMKRFVKRSKFLKNVKVSMRCWSFLKLLCSQNHKIHSWWGKFFSKKGSKLRLGITLLIFHQIKPFFAVKSVNYLCHNRLVLHCGHRFLNSLNSNSWNSWNFFDTWNVPEKGQFFQSGSWIFLEFWILNKRFLSGFSIFCWTYYILCLDPLIFWENIFSVLQFCCYEELSA